VKTSLDDDGSLDPTLAPEATGPSSEAKPSGYDFRQVLGRGGMGEVVLAEDLNIGREVAVKRMHAGADSADARKRFLREAKIQARLDHPAIVPVHEVGTDEAGVPYFTMKRLSGVTLQALLEGGEAPAQKLLRAFVDVCHAIDFAHARSVIHRDIKPSNIMLGDYGEVYVLDWGVARMADDPDDERKPLTESLIGHTQAGAILGTPGYMSPEQLLGERVSVATDVYALGAILFEILAGVPAHPRGRAALQSTLDDQAGSPRERVPERSIAPELDRICLQAMSRLPANRPTARQLADAVQRYLDGDRDEARRRELADENLTQARAAVAAKDSSLAMAAAGRALALDPKSRGAAALVTQLMLEPPAKLPTGLVDRIHRADIDVIARQGRVAAVAMLGYIVCVPFAIAAGVKEWWMLIAAVALILVVVIGAIWTSSRGMFHIMWAVLGNAAMIALITRMTSPIILTPGLAGAIAVSMMTFPTLVKQPARVIGPMLAAFLIPFVLELVGVLERTWSIGPDGLLIHPSALRFDDIWAIVFLVVANIALVIVMSLFAHLLGVGNRRAQHELERQAYQLEQLLPLDRDSRPRAR
jgi:serine/threonine-protein kinase